MWRWTVACPDVSQSMEGEGNSVEVDGQCVLMSVGQWREKGSRSYPMNLLIRHCIETHVCTCT